MQNRDMRKKSKGTPARASFFVRMTGGAVMAILILCAAVPAFSQEATGANKIFTAKKDSIYLVNQSIFLDSKKVGNIELFKKLEAAMDRKVLDQYIPLANGTAFLINGDGHLITAAHVIKYMTAGAKWDAATWSFEEYISKHMIPGTLTRAEVHAIFKEYIRLFKGANVVISLKSTDKKDYLAKVIAQNDNLDLALLKIDLDEKKTPLTVIAAPDTKVGDAVLTIGFPLQFMMDSFLDDFKPTLTNGVISAIRDDKWDLQHTASLNGGNSGGPLLNKDGDMIGVNVGLITKANNIYFSTNSGKLAGWLKEIGKDGLLAADGAAR
jgi:V8-like Glu-specific endopeptidase